LARLADDLPLFRAARRAPAAAADAMPSPIEDALREIRPDELTPREALELLYRLKGMVEE
jgi:DNA mismatch repair protein MutS